MRILPSRAPRKILSGDGKVSGVELVRCTSVFDEEGNFCPSLDEATETVEAEQVILAVGQSADLSFIGDGLDLQVEKGLIVIDPESQQTNLEGVFAGGDVGRVPGAIIDAVAAGRRAASAIDRFFGGDGKIEERLGERPDSRPYDGKRERGFADIARTACPSLPLPERHAGYDEERAVREARRCLQCDLELRLAREPKVG